MPDFPPPVSIIDLKDFIETLIDGSTIAINPRSDGYSDPIELTANNVTLDFGGSTITRTASNEYILRITGQNVFITNLLVLGGMIAIIGGDRGEGVRIETGADNCELDTVEVRELGIGNFADSFIVKADDCQLIDCTSIDAGNASVRIFNGDDAYIDNFTSTFSAATLGQWPQGTRPRHFAGTGVDPQTSLTIENSTLTSAGTWAFTVFDAGAGRLTTLNFNNNLIDNTGARFPAGNTANQRSCIKLDQIDNINMSGNTTRHGADKVMDVFFTNCVNFVGRNNNHDGYYCQLSPSLSLKSFDAEDTQWGLNAAIPWVMGRTSSEYLVDSTGTQRMTRCNAFNIKKDVPERPNPNYAAIWAHTVTTCVWRLEDVNFHFLDPDGTIADTNENATVELFEPVELEMPNMFDQSVCKAAEDVFLSEDLIGAEDLELWPFGNAANKVTFKGVFDEGGIVGSNEVQGDGRSLDRKTKYAERQSITIETSTDHPDVLAAKNASEALPTPAYWFQDTQTDPQKPDWVKRIKTGRKYQVKRIVGRDDGMMSVLVIRTKNKQRREGGITG